MYYLKIAFRNLRRNGLYSFINLLGLAIGLTAVLYISCFVVQQASYDDFHEKKEWIYRVSISMSRDEAFLGESHSFVPPIGPAMKASIPEIEEYTRICWASYPISYGDKIFKTDDILFADTAFLQMFTFPLLEGDAAVALTAPFSVVLTKETADKLFVDENPMGKMILVDGKDYYTVTGIAANSPQNSELRFNALFSFSTLYRMEGLYLDWNGENRYITYLLLHSDSDIEQITEKMNELLWDVLGRDYAEYGLVMTGAVYPLKDLHLRHGYESNFLRIAILALSLVAFLILLVACINFVNLTTARSLKRLKEAAVRKVLGAKRSDLVVLFLGESLAVSLLAFVAAMLLFKLLEPLYVALIHHDISLTGNILWVLFGMFLLTIAIGVIGGSYPVFRLPAVALSDATKSGGGGKAKKHTAQSVLIVVQLAISVFLIILTLFISRQLSYIQRKEIGFDKENIVVISLNSSAERERIAALKERLYAIPEVLSASASSDIPCYGLTQNGYTIEGEENPRMIYALDVDADFAETYGVEMKEGRFFSANQEAEKNMYIVNERLAALFNETEHVLGKRIARDGRNEIIGVVKDFHYASLYNAINPLILTCNPESGSFDVVSVKYKADNLLDFLQKMEQTWLSVNPNTVFEYAFFDDLYAKQYDLERFFRAIFLVFAFVAILLSVLGMLSLTAYAAEQRKKEIGIRKVLGASVPDILKLLLRRTVWQVIVANVVAASVALWATQTWLNNFAYRIQIEFWVFLLAFVVSLTVAVLTVLAVAWSAAREDPVKAIMSN